MIVDRLNQLVAKHRNPSMVGLDTHLLILPKEMQERVDMADPFGSAAELIVEFNKNLVDAIYDIVPCVKVQAAYYEQYGWQGMKAFSETIRYAKEKGLVVIADCKRNDIGSTSTAYANAYLGKVKVGESSISSVDADFVTVNGYLGFDGVLPFVDVCKAYDKGIFVLVKTSNPGSGELQDKHLEEHEATVYEVMGDMVKQWGSDTVGETGYGAVGAVVGATHPRQGEILRKRLPGVPFLVPGYGAQGATAADLAGLFDENGFGAYINSSRGIIGAHQKTGLPYADAARNAAIAMAEDLRGALGAAGRLSY
ncbi:MAG: orotidine-5'-phosphate decarboxylase [Clostridiales bacterium]|nr:orotidine-5'-phosphate decarboxylase [Clostridiales bacterium]